MKKTLTLLLLLSASSVNSFAQDCSTLNLDACMNAVAAQLKPANPDVVFRELKSDAADQIFNAKRALSVSTTGDTSLNGLGSSVSLNDLLPLLNMAIAPAGGDSKSASLSMEYSPMKTYLSGDFKIGGILKDPEITQPFKDSINDSNTVSSLESNLDYSDDVEVSLTYAYEGRLFGYQIGRSFGLYQALADGILNAADATATTASGFDRRFVANIRKGLQAPFPKPLDAIDEVLGSGPLKQLEEKMSEAIFEKGKTAAGAAAILDRLESLKRSLQNSDLGARTTLDCMFLITGDKITGITEESAGAFGKCVYAKVVLAAKAGAESSVARTTSLEGFLLQNNFFYLSTLVNNQPQLLLSANARVRNELVGGNSYKAKLAYEFDLSAHNINNLYRYLSSRRNQARFSAACRSEVETAVKK